MLTLVWRHWGGRSKFCTFVFQVWLLLWVGLTFNDSPNSAKPLTLNESSCLNQKSLSGRGFCTFRFLAISFFGQSIILVTGASCIPFSFLLTVGHRHVCWYKYSFTFRKVVSFLVVAYSLFVTVVSFALYVLCFFVKVVCCFFCRSIRSQSVIRWRVCCL